MTLKKIKLEIEKSLNNLYNLKMSNTLKTEAIMSAIEPLIEQYAEKHHEFQELSKGYKTTRYPLTVLKGGNDEQDSN